MPSSSRRRARIALTIAPEQSTTMVASTSDSASGTRYRAQLEQLSGLFQSFSQADASISRRFGDSRDRASRCAAVSSSEGFLAGRQGASRVNRRSAGCWLDSSTPSLLELTANEVQSGRCVSGVSASRVESCPINHSPPIAVTAYLFGLSVPVACRPLASHARQAGGHWFEPSTAHPASSFATGA
jgi:hypothetical protein